MTDKQDDGGRLVSLTVRVSVPVIDTQKAEALEQAISELVEDLENVRYDATRSIPRAGR